MSEGAAAERSGAAPLLEARSLGKSYAGPVLAEVDLDLERGEIHALVGENGAGKSTLSRILAGLIRPDAGALRFRGEPYAPRDRRDAEARGVRMVMQELNLIRTLTVAESLFLDRLPHRGGWIAYRALERAARALLAPLGLGDLDPGQAVGTLGIGRQQMVEIAAGLAGHCELLILDEPTAALTDPEIDRLFVQLRRLRAEGKAILYISHRLEEVQRISDRVSVLRDGRWVATRRTAELDLETLVRLMVGRDVSAVARRSGETRGPVALRVVNVRSAPVVRGVSFEVRGGEILGLAGLMGSGRTETLRAVFGADAREGGEVYLHGATVPASIRSPGDAVRQGLALLTENRKEQGLFLPLSVRENAVLGNLGRVCGRGGWIGRGREEALAGEWARALTLRCRSIEQPVCELSGGNQQKVVLMRWLMRDCGVVLFDEPTRGIDIGARYEIYELLAGLAARGKALVVASSDLPELMMLCDRIAVLSAGRLAATFERGDWSQERILAAAFSGCRGAGDA
ncbi:MAG TPA: sugar ABC transporter ATP-binding protein [Verrucomicrobiota bacterium]|nr:sugar ABC transporter ATP-binding protein [Verrucomicrobiota bacterium]HNU50431.1 sugar ABC transporter ATP-binding protein [Verrucomicrobiota bacterium]